MKILIVESVATDEATARTELEEHKALTGSVPEELGDIVLLTHQDNGGESQAVVLRTPLDTEEVTVEFLRL